MLPFTNVQVSCTGNVALCTVVFFFLCYSEHLEAVNTDMFITKCSAYLNSLLEYLEARFPESQQVSLLGLLELAKYYSEHLEAVYYKVFGIPEFIA